MCVGYLLFEVWSSNNLKRVPQNSILICQNFRKIPHANDVYNKALVITLIGKLFHCISNMIYLLLVRFRIGISICISSLIVHLPGRIRIQLSTFAKFPPRSNFFWTNFAQFPVLLALYWSLCCWCWWGGGWANYYFHFVIDGFLLL